MKKQPSIIRQAFASHPLSSEHASLDADTIRQLGCTIGDQVRVTWHPPDPREPVRVAIYTIVETNDGGFRLGQSGREKLDHGSSLVGQQVMISFPPTAEGGDFAEWFIVQPGNRMAVIAPHGGDIEAFTDVQARRVSVLLKCAAWGCTGTRDGGGAHDALHVTADEIAPSSFPALAPMAAQQYENVLAFHGMDSDGVLIGGRASFNLKQQICDAIAAVLPKGTNVRIDGTRSALGGSNPKNLVNRLAAGGNGLQIEQGLTVRSGFAIQIADAVAAVYARLMGTETPTTIPPAPLPATLGIKCKLTSYLVSERPPGDPDEVAIRDSSGAVLTMGSRAWVKRAKIEETARYHDKTGAVRTINTGAGGPDGPWQLLGPDTPWGLGVWDAENDRPYILEPFRSIATDPKVLPTGRRYKIVELVGLWMPSVGDRPAFVHDGIVRAVDVGPDIQGNWIDFFVGLQSALDEMRRRYGTTLDRVTVQAIP